jgi:hypothetical protein
VLFHKSPQAYITRVKYGSQYYPGNIMRRLVSLQIGKPGFDLNPRSFFNAREANFPGALLHEEIYVVFGEAYVERFGLSSGDIGQATKADALHELDHLISDGGLDAFGESYVHPVVMGGSNIDPKVKILSRGRIHPRNRVECEFKFFRIDGASTGQSVSTQVMCIRGKN